jgi:CSLREA domain-containing protein
MSRRALHDWVLSGFRSGGRWGRKRRATGGSFPYQRRLRFEPLEDRRLLATVNTLIDVNANDGLTTLREAIVAAAPGETIDFSVTGTINLSSLGQLTINKSLTITGPGASLLAINAFDPTPASNNGDGSRVFNIDDGNITADKTVALSGLTLTGGDIVNGGGAIFNRENLTVSASTISGNSAGTSGGGIVNYKGTLTVTTSTISGNLASFSGGGIDNDNGTLTVTTSTISGNSATGNGGGIVNYNGTLTVTTSTISGNSANGGGGIFHYGGGLTVTDSTISGNAAAARGGGISSNSSLFSGEDTLVVGSTISGNTTANRGGGIYNADGLTIVRYSTITDNTAPVGRGSGVASHGDTGTRTEVYSTIIADNNSSDVDFVGDLTNSFQSNGFNLIGTGNATGEFVEPGDQSGVANPLLSFLADNGGPTRTHALIVGSPAIDMGDPAIVFNPAEFDQRGNPFVRVFDGDGDATARIDIGAYERQTLPGSSLIVDTLADEDDGDYSAGDLSLREAIDLAHGSVGTETITFDAALTSSGPATILLTHGALAIIDSLTISGPGASLLTIDASGNDPTPDVNNGDGSRVFTIDDGNFTTLNDKAISISGLTLTGGDVSGFFFGTGGGIYSREDLSITSCTISGNSATGSGGGISSSGGDLTVTNSTISGNSTTGDGGAIWTGDNLLVTHSTLSGNSAARYGGGIFSVNNLTGTETTTITNSTISGNSAARSGGGIYNFEGLTVIRHSTITNNTAPVGQGSGVASFSDNATRTEVHSTIIAGNTNSNVDFVFDVTNSFQSNGYNLIGAGNATGEFVEPGDQTGVTNPMLGPLADNGGPTMTHALLAGSPAINTGDPTAVAGAGGVPVDDQRDNPFSRVNNGRIDIGAFESSIPSPLVVDTLADENDGYFGTGDLSLREAIGLARVFVGFETITFAAALTSGGPASIVLSQGELRIVDALTIDGPGANRLTIDASGNDPTPLDNEGNGSRAFNIDDGSGALIEVEISGLTLTGADVSGAGGAIFTREDLSIASSTISGNAALTGGGLRSVGGDVTVAASTISGNVASSGGGGIYSQSTSLTVTDSTISGNAANGSGGGISTLYGSVLLSHSTITGNVADADGNNSGVGGGIGVFDNPYYPSVNVQLDHTILAGNTRGTSTRSDINGPIGGARFSLVGDNTGASIVNNGGNLIGTSALPIDPMLGPLADNAGPTLTHALLTGSPAIDAGDPSFSPPPDFDQRGNPFTRVYDGVGMDGARIDIGAFELQPLPPAFFGDYNQNGTIDAADYVVWRKTLGSNVTPYSGADGDGDGTIDQDDYGVWRTNFGQTVGAGSAEQGAGSVEFATANFRQGVGSGAVAEDPHPLDYSRPLPKGEVIVGALAEPGAVGDVPVSVHVGGSRPGGSRQDAAAMWRSSTSARRDEALVAWLASRGADERREVGASVARSINRKLADVPTNVVDAVFERLNLEV